MSDRAPSYAELMRDASASNLLVACPDEGVSPVYSLPSELLSEIFLLYAENNNKLFNMRWARLMTVCRRWLLVGEESQILWSFIEIAPASPNTLGRQDPEQDAREVRRIQAQLSHAPSWPLSVKANLQPYLSAGKQACLSIFWDRRPLRSLHLRGASPRMFKVIEVLVMHPHPALAHLHIERTNVNKRLIPIPEQEASSHEIQLLLRGATFTDLFPGLRHLSIGYQPCWQLGPELRILHLNGGFLSRIFPLIDVLGALARCPLLEELAIMVWPSCPPDISANTSITLPRLRTASVRSALDVCIELYRALDVPPAALLTAFLEDINSTIDVTPCVPLASLLRSHALREGAPRFPWLEICLSKESGSWHPVIRLTVASRQTWSGHDISYGDSAGSASRHTGITTRSNRFSVARSTLTSVLPMWCLPHVTHLDIRFCDGLTPEQWHLILSSSPSIATVMLRPQSSSASSLLQVLFADLREDRKRIVTNIIFNVGRYLDSIAEGQQIGEWQETIPLQRTGESRARQIVMHTLAYCAEAARQGLPLNSVEITGQGSADCNRLIDVEAEHNCDWAELYENLATGFVYEGVLHNAEVDHDGVKRNTSILH